MLYLGILFFILAGVSEAVMDKLQFHYHTSKLSNLKNIFFWNPELSWSNKYKNKNIKMGEKFLGSTTVFVGFTDGWHLFKFFRNLFIFTGIFFISSFSCDILFSLVYTIICRVVFGLSFYFTFIFLNKKNTTV